MLDWLKYAVRVVASLCVIVVGLCMVFAATITKDATGWAIALCAAVPIGGLLAWPRRPGAWRNDRPTEKQLAYARDLGIPIPRGISKGDLSDLIDQFKNAF
jgi:hypothetical protein